MDATWAVLSLLLSMAYLKLPYLVTRHPRRGWMSASRTLASGQSWQCATLLSVTKRYKARGCTLIRPPRALCVTYWA
jgi:hypothetical protein